MPVVEKTGEEKLPKRDEGELGPVRGPSPGRVRECLPRKAPVVHEPYKLLVLTQFTDLGHLYSYSPPVASVGPGTGHTSRTHLTTPTVTSSDSSSPDVDLPTQTLGSPETYSLHNNWNPRKKEF